VHDETVVSEFTGQAASFNASAAANDRATLDALVRLAAPGSSERWLEAACGSGVISRGLAPRVRAVHGIDMTPTMVDLARGEAASAGLGNLEFSVGDATAPAPPTRRSTVRSPASRSTRGGTAGAG
jgi:tRNA/tmRNA/rRNA uracil-C5-methylase (TrmA/RlmC/RlmD family)